MNKIESDQARLDQLKSDWDCGLRLEEDDTDWLLSRLSKALDVATFLKNGR